MKNSQQRKIINETDDKSVTENGMDSIEPLHTALKKIVSQLIAFDRRKHKICIS